LAGWGGRGHNTGEVKLNEKKQPSGTDNGTKGRPQRKNKGKVSDVRVWEGGEGSWTQKGYKPTDTNTHRLGGGTAECRR